MIVIKPPGGEKYLEVIDSQRGTVQIRSKIDRESLAKLGIREFDILVNDQFELRVNIKDKNDNAPQWIRTPLNITFPEKVPIDSRTSLGYAFDDDTLEYSTKNYEIVSGNIHDTFRLQVHKKVSFLYVDLIVNRVIDYETVPHFKLVINAYDGGSPRLSDSLVVNIDIIDSNDSPPIFNLSRFSAEIPENSNVGTQVRSVTATDLDTNDVLSYTITNYKDKFQIDEKSGMLTVAGKLDYERETKYDVIVVCSDKAGLDATAVVSVSVTNVNDNYPTIDVKYLAEDGSNRIVETAEKGDYVARLSVSDADEPDKAVNVTIKGDSEYIGLDNSDKIIYLKLLSVPDREKLSEISVTITATDSGTPTLRTKKTIILHITDSNDNTPKFDKDIYSIVISESLPPGSSVLHLHATDLDEGDNALLRYSWVSTQSLFNLDAESGLITTSGWLDCEKRDEEELEVRVTDSGLSPLSSKAKIHLKIEDVDDNIPIFDLSFYNATIEEDAKEGHCFLQVSS
ncbi:unnamed protein product [Dimorphilus gyrociliatus]|uniref:Cadherin domain-containing protein n=1 Tax=Dimorphilus gyrociliatus TaxID=2664684 RepID=A0A7I8WCH6_9ANNE|nr:unnamed protein product [Dimorphilus gyrociliatus]